MKAKLLKGNGSKGLEHKSLFFLFGGHSFRDVHSKRFPFYIFPSNKGLATFFNILFCCKTGLSLY